MGYEVSSLMNISFSVSLADIFIEPPHVFCFHCLVSTKSNLNFNLSLIYPIHLHCGTFVFFASVLNWSMSHQFIFNSAWWEGLTDTHFKALFLYMFLSEQLDFNCRGKARLSEVFHGWLGCISLSKTRNRPCLLNGVKLISSSTRNTGYLLSDERNMMIIPVTWPS